MNYCFSTLTTTILCLFFVGFADESYAQYNSPYDSKGNVSPSSRAASEARNKQIINYNNPPYYNPPKNSSSSKPERKPRIVAGRMETPVYSFNGSEDKNSLYLVRKTTSGYYGYIDSWGKEVIYPFYTDYKSVKSKGYYALKNISKLWGFKDKEDKTILPFIYDDVIETFENGIAMVVLKGRSIWIDESGNELSDQEAIANKLTERLAGYTIAKTVDEYGLRLVSRKEVRSFPTKYYGYLNNDNIEVISSSFTDYKIVSEGYYALKLDGFPARWIFKNRDGKTIIDFVYEDVLNTFRNGIAKVVLDNQIIWIDKRGNQIYGDDLERRWAENKTTAPPLNSEQMKRSDVLALDAGNLSELYQANKKLELQKYEEAITIYTKVIGQNIDKTVADAYYGRGKAKLLLNKKEGACPDLKMAASLGHSGANELISKNCNVENKTSEKVSASSIPTKPAVVTSTNKAKSKGFYNDGFEKYERKDFRNAITAFTNAVNADPENLEAWYYRAFAKYNLQDYTGAIADFNKIKFRATTNIGSSDIIYNLGLAKFKLKDYKSAIDDMTYAVGLNMGNANAYFGRALIKTILNDDTGAIEDYTKVIAIDPGHIKAWLNRGNAKSRLHKYEEAILDYKQLTVIAPTNSHAWLYMANRKFDLQNYREALTDYNKVIELKNKETVLEAYYYRGFAKLQLNENEAACIDLRMAVSLGHPDNDALISKNCK